MELQQEFSAARDGELYNLREFLDKKPQERIAAIIRQTGIMYANEGNFDKCIKLWIYNLDLQQESLEPLSPMTQETLQDFAALFSHMMSEAGESPPVFQDVLNVFKRTLLEIKMSMKDLPLKEYDGLNVNRHYQPTLITAMHLIAIMCRLKPDMQESEELELKEAVYQLVHMNPKTLRGWTPLHIACYKGPTPYEDQRLTFLIYPEIVDLLLEVGACPNAMDIRNNTPLHMSALYAPSVFKSLLEHGAHLDLCNNEKQTPLQLIQSTHSLDVYPLQYINLQCLSAQAVRRHNIIYKEIVDKKLEVFIDGH